MHSREGTKQPRPTIKSALPYTLGITLATNQFSEEYEPPCL